MQHYNNNGNIYLIKKNLHGKENLIFKIIMRGGLRVKKFSAEYALV